MEDNEQKTRKEHGTRSWFFKRQVAIEYVTGTKTLQELSLEYGVPHQTISRWGKSYASDLRKAKGRNFNDMTPEEQKYYEELKHQNEQLKKELASIQTDQRLKEENEALKKDLEFAQMKTKAMEIIIDLAKEEYGIDLRKNSGAKQPESSRRTTRRQE